MCPRIHTMWESPVFELWAICVNEQIYFHCMFAFGQRQHLAQNQSCLPGEIMASTTHTTCIQHLILKTLTSLFLFIWYYSTDSIINIGIRRSSLAMNNYCFIFTNYFWVSPKPNCLPGEITASTTHTTCTQHLICKKLTSLFFFS